MNDLLNGWDEDGEPMSDLVERLRAGSLTRTCYERMYGKTNGSLIWAEAADEIERLRAGFESEEEQSYVHNEVTGLHNEADLREIERLRAALRQLKMAESEAVRNHVKAALREDEDE